MLLFLGQAVEQASKLLQEKLQGIDYKVDLLHDIAILVPLLLDRVARALEAEGKSDGVPIEITDAAVRTYSDFLMRWRQVAQDLGVHPLPPMPNIDMRSQTMVFSQEAIDDLRQYARRLLQRKGIEP